MIRFNSRLISIYVVATTAHLERKSFILILFIIRSLAINIGVYSYIFTSDYNHVLPNEKNKMEMFWKPFN